MAPFAIAATLLTFALAACSTGGGAVLDTTASNGPATSLSMAGRWMFAAPNAPPCGVELRSRSGQAGDMTPDGGCPGSLYKARHWTLTDGVLTVASGDDEALAQLDSKGEHFEGRTADGLPLTLSRKPSR
ncbi:MAG: AprI/Inh family metalloprotease inhibitor [Xanthobacteraceae bacterium]|uniref:AprI/Inh family metalloprotease inhibitor n=1 Tax=Pseudolabrys sp. TaxID=1960880 RepID=UPI003D110EB6